jgi:hypothetical protein
MVGPREEGLGGGWPFSLLLESPCTFKAQSRAESPNETLTSPLLKGVF